MKTFLYKDSTNSDLKTFEELKELYVEINNSDLPIPDDDMNIIIMTNLVQNGGNIILIKDEILDWCNDYSDYKEADRFLYQSERDESIKDIYLSISNKIEDEFIINIIDELRNDNTEEANELLDKFNSLSMNQ